MSIPQIDRSHEKDEKSEKSEREKTTIVDESFIKDEDFIEKQLNYKEIDKQKDPPLFKTPTIAKGSLC